MYENSTEIEKKNLELNYCKVLICENDDKNVDWLSQVRKCL